MSDQAQSLDEFLGDEFDVDIFTGTDQTTKEPFVCDNERKAEWALNKLAEADAEISRHDAFADERIQRIQQWLEDVSKDPLATAERMQSFLRYYHELLLEENPKKKTVKLPAGTLEARKSPDSWDVRDTDALLAWLKENAPDLVRTKEEPDKSGIKKTFAPRPGPEDAEYLDAYHPVTGEIIPGVIVVPGTTVFRAKPTTGGDAE